MSAKVESTSWDLARIRETMPPRQMPVDEPFPFFPVQTPPAFSDHGETCRCPEHK